MSEALHRQFLTSLIDAMPSRIFSTTILNRFIYFTLFGTPYPARRTGAPRVALFPSFRPLASPSDWPNHSTPRQANSIISFSFIYRITQHLSAFSP